MEGFKMKNSNKMDLPRNECSFTRWISVLRIMMVIVVIAGLAVVLTGCVPGDGVSTANNKAGFFSGIWHGWIAPFSLIYSLFNHDISIYEVNNIGWWYDFGYYIAVISGFGCIAFSRRRSKEKVVKHTEKL
jgi:hypothetical protein